MWGHKREFVKHVSNHMTNEGHVQGWRSADESNRNDCEVDLKSGRIAAIELRGCLDGNNTSIFERPHDADEFIVWRVCTNPGADLRHNA